MQMNNIRLLHDILKNELTPDDREWLMANGKEKLVLENEIIIMEGEKPDNIIVILSGLFAVTSENNKDVITVGPGDILGIMTFLTETVVTASVSAIEPNSIVLEIPQKNIAKHLVEDASFASRFYRLTATMLSKRLQKMIATFLMHPKVKPNTKTSPALLGPVPLFEHDSPNFELIRRLLDSSPSVSNIYKNLQQNDNDLVALKQRERRLSVATMAAESLKLLWEIARSEGIIDLDRRIIQHKSSITAAETQALLTDYHIQKTITILIENKFVLCSCIGDLKIQHNLLRKIATMLDLPHAGFNSYINPPVFVPEIELGLLRGMVSTFFSPGRITQLSLVAFITSPNLSKEIAVSLSPFESVLLPYDLFPKIVKKYAEIAYPYLPFTELSIDD